jgi:hypothetical protein
MKADNIPIFVQSQHPQDNWKPGDICYYWRYGTVVTAVFCRWTVGDKQWAAVFDLQPKAEAIDKDGYDYATSRVTYRDLFRTREEVKQEAVRQFALNLDDEKLNQR